MKSAATADVIAISTAWRQRKRGKILNSRESSTALTRCHLIRSFFRVIPSATWIYCTTPACAHFGVAMSAGSWPLVLRVVSWVGVPILSTKCCQFLQRRWPPAKPVKVSVDIPGSMLLLGRNGRGVLCSLRLRVRNSARVLFARATASASFTCGFIRRTFTSGARSSSRRSLGFSNRQPTKPVEGI